MDEGPSLSIVHPQETSQKFFQVAVDAPISDLLTYTGVNQHPGQFVEIPLGKRKVSGIIFQEIESDKLDFDPKKVKSILDKVLPYPILSPKTLKWLKWISDYYQHPLGQVAKLTLPPLEKKRGRESKKPPVVPTLERKASPTLTEEQTKILSSIENLKGFSTHLVFGVTGSGKTEIYMHLIERALEQGKKALFLVPEIALTPQLTHRFVERFGDHVAVLHSQLTDRERTDQWWDIIEGKRQILVGARSALFCPVENIGIIVVDEEHEASYKQDEKLKYNGRDCAVMLGKILEIPVILGSATPSLETWKNAQEGKYHFHQLTKRVFQQEFPQTSVVDMKLEKEKVTGLPLWLSGTLFERLQSTMERGLQAALLLNRRGLAQVVMCKSCGHTSKCPNCEISLTLHHKTNLVCHYCDYQERMTEDCPQCSEGTLEPLGIGTEQVEKDLRLLFPDKNIARADRDEISHRADLEDLISRMENGEIDILVGTQMIAKGLDFKNLYLVGFVLADIGFNLPDFRSTERSFQLITQMSGRAGRHQFADGTTGEVLIQAFNTNHPCLEFVLGHNYKAFAEKELSDRKDLHYPPYSKIVCLRIQGAQLNDVESSGNLLKRRAEALSRKNPQFEEIQVLGPAPAPLAKLRGQHRAQMLLKATQPQYLNLFLKNLFHDRTWIPKQIKIVIDVDPLHLL